MIRRRQGYEVQLCMPECVSTERRLILEGLGANVMLTPAKENIDGAVRQAYALMEERPASTTCRSIRERGQRPCSFRDHGSRESTGRAMAHVTTSWRYGHLGTLNGRREVPEVSEAIREDRRRRTGRRPHDQGLKNMTESMCPGSTIRKSWTKRKWWKDGEAFETTKLLATKEDCLRYVLRRGGRVALRIAAKLVHGTIVAILPDRGDRYLSTMQFRSVCAKVSAVSAMTGASSVLGGATKAIARGQATPAGLSRNLPATHSCRQWVPAPWTVNSEEETSWQVEQIRSRAA